MTTHAPLIRGLYRRFLRELPAKPDRSQSILSAPSPVQARLRQSFRKPEPGPGPGPHAGHAVLERRLGQAEQYLKYLQAQRQYLTLLERYNPGVNASDEEDRVRLTARRVGMELPLGGGMDRRH